MSNKPSPIAGLKVTCSACEKEFAPHKAQQQILFGNEPLPCPKCNSLQCLPNDQCESLLAQGNPGRGFMIAMGGMGVWNVAFFGAVLAGLIRSDGIVLLGFVLAIGGQLAVSIGFNSATSHLRGKLSPAGQAET